MQTLPVSLSLFCRRPFIALLSLPFSPRPCRSRSAAATTTAPPLDHRFERPAAPSNLTYPQTTITATIGVAITTDIPIVRLNGGGSLPGCANLQELGEPRKEEY
jgi:hypothetical protein